jgi:hypothetical protein
MVVLRYFRFMSMIGQDVVFLVFSCAAENFFRAFPLAIPVPDLALTSGSPLC